MAALTQEDILTFLLDHGGKVKNSDLLNYFRRQINSGDPAEKQHNRDAFKRFVNSVAVVKQVDGVKFVVVKKRYRDFVKGVGMMMTMSVLSDESDDVCRQNTSLTSSSTGSTEERSESEKKMLYSDFENNNLSCASNINNYLSDNTKDIDLHSSDLGKAGLHSSFNLNSVDATTTVKVLSISSDQTSCRTRRSGAVFAVIAVKSPPRLASTECPDPVLVDVTQEGLNPPLSLPKTPEKLNTMMTPKVPPEAPGPVMDVKCSEQDEWNSSSPWSKNRQTERETLQAPSSPQPKRPQNKTSRQGDDAKDSESPVPLEPIAHEWLVKSATGLWGQLYGLLLQDTQLARKKDFMSGYTALHWSAKAGNADMVHKIMAISKKRGIFVDVNSKTHGGYTPLHIAAIHGHHEVMLLLVQSYGAKVNMRDNDGKKPYHYLDGGVSAEVKDLLGWSQPSQQDRDRMEHELPKGLNTISKLFQPHTHRKKHKQRRRLSTPEA